MSGGGRFGRKWPNLVAPGTIRMLSRELPDMRMQPEEMFVPPWPDCAINAIYPPVEVYYTRRQRHTEPFMAHNFVEEADQQRLCTNLNDMAEFAYANITDTDAIQDGLAKIADKLEAILHSRFLVYGRWASQSSQHRGCLLTNTSIPWC